ncbi:MAG: hypothetical protein CMI00_13085 [Oceanospirillaceae bacterium]|nr:hypothetical protein [Oceanospirillaceae bacterium]|tara:strand:- start:1041 stop:1466 length:426 start_codon:yes stop_codon:yes gene_type:complete
MAASNSKAGKLTGKNATRRSFAGIPRNVMESPDFRALSPNARNLLLILAYYYRGKNNGDLSAPFKVMKEQWGFNSPETLNKAKKELLERNLIIETRAGRFQNPGGTCSLYALTWEPINDCGGKLDVAATITPPRCFSIERS